ncbi:MAG: hypothetical protein M3512_17680 [Bacteroidota bacterium]|nr:hypothetical protein [Bacteroidota bacterium]
MDFNEFKNSLNASHPPAGIPKLVEALWFEKKGDWDAAHDISQDVNTLEGAWVHAYLHRKEGDIGNASYWYARAGRKMPEVSLDDEWEVIVKDFLNHAQKES